MLRQSVVLAMALSLAGLVQADSADGPTTGQLTSSEIDAEGIVGLEASLLALTRFDLSPEGLLPATEGQSPDPFFQLHAAALRIETYEADPYGKVAGSFVAPPAERSEQTYGAASVEGVDNRWGYRFDLFPLDSGLTLAKASAGCANLQPSTKPTYGAVPKVSASSPTFQTNVANTVQWTECSQSSLTIVGSFVVVLWEWDAQIHANGETTPLLSGVDRTSTVPEPAAGAVHPSVGHARQQYLYAENAVLTIPRMDNTTHWAYLDAPQLNTEGTLRFTNATGQLEQHGILHPIQAGSLSVAGGLDLQSIRSLGKDRSLQADIDGRLDNAEADGQPLAFVATTAVDEGLSWLWMGLVGAVLMPAALVPIARRQVLRRRVPALRERSRELVNQRRFPEAAALVRQWEGIGPKSPELHVRWASILAAAGNWPAAWEHREAAHRMLRHLNDPYPLAENSFERAVLACLRSKQDGEHWRNLARIELGQAVALRPSLRLEADRHPELRDLHR